MRYPQDWHRVVEELAEREGLTTDEALELSLEALRRLKEWGVRAHLPLALAPRFERRHKGIDHETH